MTQNIGRAKKPDSFWKFVTPDGRAECCFNWNVHMLALVVNFK